MYFEVLLRKDVPNPFGGDVVLFPSYRSHDGGFGHAAACATNDRTTRLGTLDFALLFVWWLYLYLFAVIPWQYVHPYEPSYDHNLNILYLTEKISIPGRRGHALDSAARVPGESSTQTGLARDLPTH